jgi:hypothetical protein
MDTERAGIRQVLARPAGRAVCGVPALSQCGALFVSLGRDERHDRLTTIRRNGLVTEIMEYAPTGELLFRKLWTQSITQPKPPLREF